MKIRYRMIARRITVAPRQLRLRTDPAAMRPELDDPMELPSELIDLATGKLAIKSPKGR